MALTSADRAFGIIAIQRKILTKGVVDAEERLLEEKLSHGINVSLAQHLITVGKLDAGQRADIERIRSKHGRDCEKCLRATYLLPGEAAETKPCEHCGGKLKLTAAPAAAAPAPAAAPAATPGPGAAPSESPKPTGKIDRSPISGAAPSAAKPLDPLEEAQKKERARKLRMANAFGYEPPPPAPAKAAEPAPAAEAAPADAAPATAVADHRGAPAPVARLVAPGPSFAPPDHFQPAAPAIPNLPFFEEAMAVLAFPFRRQIVAVLTVGAVAGAVLGTFSWLMSCLILIYYYAWQVKVANHVTAGKTEDIPDWPDTGEMFGLAGRLFLCTLASSLPMILAVVVMWRSIFGGGGGVELELRPTVGDDQHTLSGAGDKIVGNDVSDEEFLDARDSTVKLSDFKGKWLVFGLIDVDDSGDNVLRRGTPPQAYDLDRLSRADPTFAVVAVVVDPGQRIMKRLGVVQEDVSEEHPLVIPDEFKRMKLVRTREFHMPEKFGKKGHAPAIWIIDPSGKVKLQFDSGASDHAIYGALNDLRKGGNGSAKPRPLPGERGGMNVSFAGLGFGVILFLFGLAFGFVYHPMAFLMTIVFTNGTLAFNYVAGFTAIGKTLGDYAKTLMVLFLAGIVGSLLSWALENVLLVPFPTIVRSVGSNIVGWWVLLYGLLVEAYALGRFYLRNKQTLGWF